MKGLLSIFIVLGVVLSKRPGCVGREGIPVQVVEVSYSSPVSGNSKYRVYYSDSLVVYQWETIFDSLERDFHYDSVTSKMSSDEKLVLSEKRIEYFIYHQDSGWGYHNRPKVSNSFIRTKVATMLELIKGTNRFDSFLTIKPFRSLVNSDGSELTEEFLLPGNEKLPDGRAIFYYTSRLNHLKESLNPVMDSVKKRKLFKVEAKFDPIYDSSKKIIWPATTTTNEMRELKAEKNVAPIDLMRRYRREAMKRQ